MNMKEERFEKVIEYKPINDFSLIWSSIIYGILAIICSIFSFLSHDVLFKKITFICAIMILILIVLANIIMLICARKTHWRKI